jgi:hypothetical protein
MRSQKYYREIYTFLNEDDSDRYVHIGYGRYKEKGKEKDKDSQTFKKEKSGKFVPVGTDEPVEKPKTIGKDADATDKAKEPAKDKPDAKPEKSKQAEPQKLKAADFKSAAEKDAEADTEVDDEWEKMPFKEKLKVLAKAFSDWWDDNNAWKEKPKGSRPDTEKSQRSKDTAKLRDLMPGGDFTKRPLSSIPKVELDKVATKIDDLARMGKEAKEKGEKAPNYNLCQVSIPGTNLYCSGNKGIPRAEMPQFKGTPEPGSRAEKLPKDKNGEVDTEEFFKQMLEKDGVKVSEPTAVPPDRLKSTQSELVGVKVAGMSQVLDAGANHPAYGAITAPIYVSNDGYVLDGHHRWAAVVAHNAKNPDNQIPMNVRVIDEPIEPLVKRSNKFAEDIGIKPKAADTGSSGGPAPIAEKKSIHRRK